MLKLWNNDTVTVIITSSYWIHAVIIITFKVLPTETQDKRKTTYSTQTMTIHSYITQYSDFARNMSYSGLGV